jgi:fumarate hydratase class II
MMPVVAYNVLLSEQILATAMCIVETKANEEQCLYWLERSAALATALAPQIGYARAAELSKQSVKENILIRDLVRREQVLPPDEIDAVLDMRKMTEIGVPGGAHGGVSAG